MAEQITIAILDALSEKLRIDPAHLYRNTPIDTPIFYKDIEDIYKNVCVKFGLRPLKNPMEAFLSMIEVDQHTGKLVFESKDNCEFLVHWLSIGMEACLPAPKEANFESALFENYYYINQFVLESPIHQPLKKAILTSEPSLAGIPISIDDDQDVINYIIIYGQENNGWLGLDGLLKMDYPIRPKYLFITYAALALARVRNPLKEDDLTTWEKNQTSHSGWTSEDYLARALEWNDRWGPYLKEQELETLIQQVRRKQEPEQSSWFRNIWR